MLRSIAVVTGLSALLASGDAEAWKYAEHVELGSEGYKQACEDLAELIGARPRALTDDAVQVRYEIACGNLDVMAQLYGQATALGGDHLRRPQDLLSATVGKKTASRTEYLRLALVNSSHYHPLAPRVWREHHQRAVAYAMKAASQSGLGAVESFEIAFYFSAFADHFLHDSFVSGHMGFNRAASSVAASLAFHNTWNRRGRRVRNRAGESWKTYGDGRLNRKANAEGRKHALEAAKLSIYTVLVAFVEGKPDVRGELEVWRALPFVIEAPALPSVTDRLLGPEEGAENLHPLGAINRPARKDTVLDIRFVASGRLEASAPAVAGLVGFNLSLPRLPTLTRLAAGATLPRGEQDLHLAIDLGFIRQLGLTVDGLLTHEMGMGFLWEVRRDHFTGSLHAGYQVTLELGLDLLRIEIGPAFRFPDKKAGYIAGITYGRVFSAAGGGVK